MAEQSVVDNLNNTVNCGGRSASGGTQLAERSAQAQGADESATSAKATRSTASVKRSGFAGVEPKAIPFAAVSFVCGLVGLLVANLLLGPLAIVLGLIGLRADSGRRARATLGILLGIADIALFVLVAAHAGAHHGSLSWNFLSR